jgi:hypothetical protein
MTLNQVISVVVAVGSAWLGGSLGAAALERANAAPLTRTASVALPVAPGRLPRLPGPDAAPATPR